MGSLAAKCFDAFIAPRAIGKVSNPMLSANGLRWQHWRRHWLLGLDLFWSLDKFTLGLTCIAPIAVATCPSRELTSRVLLRMVDRTYGLNGTLMDHRGTGPTKPSGGLRRILATYSPP